jgi:uncharacterized protein (TIGR04222 family)
MNVLEMRGPPFLLLYGAAAIMGCAILWWSIRQREARASASPLRVRDPYEIAYLRGGIQELVKVVVLALLRRQLLLPAGDCLQAAAGATRAATATIERTILITCRSPIPAKALAEFGTVKSAGKGYHLALADKHLMPDAAMLRARIAGAAIAFALLGGFAFLKIAHALDTGHSNIGLLVCLVVIAALVLFKIAYYPRTAAGDLALRHLGSLFSRVKSGPRPVHPDQLNEALLLAAVYGDYAQSGSELAVWRRLFPALNRDGNSGSGSCGSGCGSGCGGGGGCGGCGS